MPKFGHNFTKIFHIQTVTAWRHFILIFSEKNYFGQKLPNLGHFSKLGPPQNRTKICRVVSTPYLSIKMTLHSLDIVVDSFLVITSSVCKSKSTIGVLLIDWVQSKKLFHFSPTMRASSASIIICLIFIILY